MNKDLYLDFLLQSNQTPNEIIFKLITMWDEKQIQYFVFENKEWPEERLYRLTICWMMRKFFPSVYYAKKKELKRLNVHIHDQSIMSYFSRVLATA